MAYHLPNPGEHNGEAAFHPPIFINPDSKLTRMIGEGRAAIAQLGKYGVREYDDMLRTIVGRDDLSTEDEKFLDYCVKVSSPAAKEPVQNQSQQRSRPSLWRKLCHWSIVPN
jgi:hypothetical protein